MLSDLHSCKVHKNIPDRANLLPHRAAAPSWDSLEVLARPCNTASWLKPQNVIRMKCHLFKFKSRTCEEAFLIALGRKMKNRLCLRSDPLADFPQSTLFVTGLYGKHQTCKNYLHMGVTIYVTCQLYFPNLFFHHSVIF